MRVGVTVGHFDEARSAARLSFERNRSKGMCACVCFVCVLCACVLVCLRCMYRFVLCYFF